MAKLLWSQLGERQFETGLDHGVLYTDVTVVPWLGLISITEDFGGDTTSPSYFDGIKRNDHQTIGDFAATLTAYTYPNEFLELIGIKQITDGTYIDGQKVKTFGLCYRTLLGNDLVGNAYAYQLHIVYNITATPDATVYETLSDSFNPTQFSWSLTGIPEAAPNYRPTAHIILDSRYLNSAVLLAIEDILYGTDPDEEHPGTEPRLPSLVELLDFVLFWDPKIIIPQTLTGLAELASGYGDLTQTNISGLYYALPETRLVPTSLPGFYELGSGTPDLVVEIVDNGDGTWTANDDGTHISMTNATTFQIININAAYADLDTYTITDTYE